MTSWNYRIIARAGNGEESYGVHEVYYEKDGSIRNYTLSPVGVTSDSFAELPNVFGMMIKAFTLPVLKESDLPT